MKKYNHKPQLYDIMSVSEKSMLANSASGKWRTYKHKYRTGEDDENDI